jgi:probable HAF family extracellular repeat protein
MKSTALTCITAVTLFVALVISVPLRAQEQKEATSEHHRYKLVDIGTFGGPTSFLNPPFNTVPALNSRGTTVGSSATSVPTTATSNGFVCGGIDGIVPFVFHAFKWQDGVVSDLGALPPGDENCSNAVSINARGEIVGVSETGEIDPLLGSKGLRALLWKDDEMVDLGTLGGKYAVPTHINNRAQVVGGATNTKPDPFSIFGTQTRAFLWQDGIMQDLGTLGGPESFAGVVNERGQVAGFSFTNFTPNPVTGVPTVHPFLWENGKMTDLGSLGGTLAGYGNFNMFGGFNNRGELVGLSTLAGDQIVDPFLWNGEKLIDLNTDTMGGNPLTANAINDAGEVVGGGAFPNRPFDAYLWKNGVATDLGTLDGDCYSEGWAINSSQKYLKF